MRFPAGFQISPATGVGFIGKADGRAVWTPSRAHDCDWSKWGPWEVWQIQADGGEGRLTVTGDWAAWDAEGNRRLSFPPGTHKSAKEKAEMFAVSENGGKPTRIVYASGAWRASALGYEDVSRQIAETCARMEAS